MGGLNETQLRNVARLFERVKKFGRTNACGVVARKFRLPYDVVYELLLGDAYNRREQELLEVFCGRLSSGRTGVTDVQ